MLRHPEFNINDVQSTTIMHLLRRLELPFMECAVCTYNLWKPGDGNQKLDLMIRNYFEVFIHRNYARSTVAGAFRPRFSPSCRITVDAQGATYRAAVFFRFLAGLSVIALQELLMERTSRIENKCGLQELHPSLSAIFDFQSRVSPIPH